jgi:diketogulonate reductase-like aldo/keto reductase
VNPPLVLHDTNYAAVAIAYLMHKTTHVFPIIGGRKVEHLMANIEALEISLTREHIKALESVAEFELGFPGSFIVRDFASSIFVRSLGCVGSWF